MNGRKAKLLRRVAFEQSIGNAAVQYEVRVSANKITATGELTPSGTPIQIQTTSYLTRLAQSCTRAVYKRLKQAQKVLKQKGQLSSRLQ